MTSLSKFFMIFCLLVLASCSAERSSEEHINHAKQYLAKSDHKSAQIELKNALSKESSSAEARWLLGKLQLEMGNELEAEKELIKAQELGWDPNDTRPALARTFLSSRKFEAVEAIPDAGLEPAAAAKLLSVKSLARLAQGDAAGAEGIINIALELQPDLEDVKVAKARILASKGELPATFVVLDEILVANPESANAWGLKGEALLSQKDLQGAKEAFDRAIDFSAGGDAYRFKRALINIELNDYDSAQADVDYLLKSAPKQAESHYVAGLLLLHERDYAGSISELTLAVPISQQYPQVLLYLSTAHFIEGNLNQASTTAARFLEVAPDNVAAIKLLAAASLLQGDSEYAEALTQSLIDEYPEDLSALNLMTYTLVSSGNSEQAINLLEQIALMQPNSSTAQIKLATSLFAAGKNEEATEHIQAALDLDPDSEQAEGLLVLGYLRQGETDKALASAKEYSVRFPDKATPYNLLASVFLATGQPEEAVAALERALDLDPGNPGANYGLAQLAIAGGDLATARKHYETIIAEDATSLEVLIQLAYLDAQENEEEEMLNHLNTAAQSNPTALAPRILLARYYLSKGRSEQVEPLFADLPQDQKGASAVLHMTALAQIAQNQYDQAQYTLETLIESAPETASSHHLMALAAKGTGNEEQSITELQRALMLDPDYGPALVEAARMAQVEGDAKAFEEYVGKLAELAPEHPDVLRLRAALAFSKNKTTEAVHLSELAFAASPNTQTMGELTAYQFASGDRDKAHKQLLAWVKQHPDDTTARIGLADFYLSGNQIKEAVNEYEAILKLDSDNILALNNYAWHTRLENLDLALEYSRRAAELAPTRPEILDTLAMLEHLDSNNLVAQRHIERALAEAPGNASILYHKAVIKAAIGDKASAMTILEDLLRNNERGFPERAEAETLLNSLSG